MTSGSNAPSDPPVERARYGVPEEYVYSADRTKAWTKDGLHLYELQENGEYEYAGPGPAASATSPRIPEMAALTAEPAGSPPAVAPGQGSPVGEPVKAAAAVADVAHSPIDSRAGSEIKPYPQLIGALGACVAGVVFLLTTDFGGWTEHTPFSSEYTDYWVGLDADELPGYAYVLIILVAGSFLFPALSAAAALIGSRSVIGTRLVRAYRAAALTAVAVLAGGLLFASQVSDEYDWWFDVGFSGSLLSAVAAALLLYWASRATGREVVRPNKTNVS